MRSKVYFHVLSVPLIALSLLAQTNDIAGSSDPFLFRRVPGFHIAAFRDTASATVTFRSAASAELPVEGHKIEITYRNDGPGISPSSILQHYQRAALGLGGRVVNEAQQSATYLAPGKSTEIWLAVEVPDAMQYKLIAIERGAVVPEVTVDDMLSTLEREGRLALYVKFDPDEAIIKPESQPVIAKAAQALQRSPLERVSVEGHTDFIGNPAANKVLSTARAKVVADSLVARGIDPKRLSVTGFGQDRPIADNTTEEGRAKNRRIELVNPDFQRQGAPVSTASHPKDAKGTHDHPLFPRVAGYYLSQSDVQDATDVIFAVGKPGNSRDVTLHGRRQDLVYRFDDLGGKPMPGPEQILRYYADAARRTGGTVQYESSSALVTKQTTGASEVWARITAAGGEQYTITVVTPALQ